MTHFHPGRMCEFAVWRMVGFRFHGSRVLHGDDVLIEEEGDPSPELIGPLCVKETMKTPGEREQSAFPGMETMRQLEVRQ